MIKKFKLFESNSIIKLSETNFDDVILYKNSDIDIDYDGKISDLNNMTGNFDPGFIKGFLIDFVEYEVIDDIKIIKKYSVEKTILRSPNFKLSNYLKWDINVEIKLNKDFEYSKLKLRGDYIKERDRIMRLIHEYYGIYCGDYGLTYSQLMKNHKYYVEFINNDDYFKMMSNPSLLLNI
jgi:hypothetical protein